MLVLVGPLLSPLTLRRRRTGTQFRAAVAGQRPLVRHRSAWAAICSCARLYGGRISLLVGAVATAVSLLIGISYGAMAGYVGGRVDQVMMRIVDILYALPFMFLVILLMVLFGRNIVLIFFAIGAINWLDMARIVRGQALSLRGKEYVEAARAGGVRGGRIIRRHIVPNLLGVVIVYATLTVPQVILVESFLSFLGLGVQEPMTSWGALVNEGAQELENAPWMLLFPATWLALTSVLFQFCRRRAARCAGPADRRADATGLSASRPTWACASQRPTATWRRSADLNFRGVSRRMPGHCRRVRFGQEPERAGADGSAGRQRPGIAAAPTSATGTCWPCRHGTGRTCAARRSRWCFRIPMTALNPYLSIGQQMSLVLRRHEGRPRGRPAPLHRNARRP